MKRLALLFTILFFISCSKDETSSSIAGCTDPQAVNYNVDATENDNSCQYSILGKWTATEYTTSDGVNLLAQYRYITYEIFDDSRYRQESGVLNSTDIDQYTGTYFIGGFNNSQITFTVDDTNSSTTATIISITSNKVILTFDVSTSVTATIELIKT